MKTAKSKSVKDKTVKNETAQEKKIEVPKTSINDHRTETTTVAERKKIIQQQGNRPVLQRGKHKWHYYVVTVNGTLYYAYVKTHEQQQAVVREALRLSSARALDIESMKVKTSEPAGGTKVF